mgnify:CR=1 FL=1
MSTDLSKVNPNSKQILANSIEDLGKARISDALDNSIFSSVDERLRISQSEFKAVVISGFRTGDNITGIDEVDSNLTKGYIIVRPLDIPVPMSDPFDYSNMQPIIKERVENQEGLAKLQYSMSMIRLHAVKYLVKFENVNSIDKNKPNFGEIVTCYYEGGARGDITKLRYRESLSKRDKYPPYSDIDGSLFSDDFRDNAKSIWKSGGESLKVGDYDLVSPKDTTGYMSGSTRVYLSRYQYSKQKYGKSIEGQDRAKYFTEQGISSNIMHYRGTDNLNKIILHYTAGGKDVYDILYSENKNKSNAYGYHFMIDRDGSFIASCPIDHWVAHAKGANGDSVGIAFVNQGFITSKALSDKIKFNESLLLAEAKYSTDPKTGEQLITATKHPWWEKFRKGPNPANSNKLQWFEEYTEEAKQTAATIVSQLINTVPSLSLDSIETHTDSSSGKSDTGPLLPLDKFKTRIELISATTPPLRDWKDISGIVITDSYGGME